MPLIPRILLPIALAVLAIAPTASAQEVREQLKKLKAEPNVRQVQEAALGYFKVNQNSVASMRSRASAKAAVPVLEVSGGFARSIQDETAQNYSVFIDGSDWIVKGASGDSFDIRGKLTWDLPRLIFNAEELDVASLAGLMEGILKESTRLYFMRRRLQVDMILTPPADQATLISKQLRLEELTALIDAMTGGWFQERLNETGTGRVSATKMAPAYTAALGVIPLKKEEGAASSGRTVVRVRSPEAGKTAAPVQ
ncbi:MAG: hypothetical protein ACI9OJ_000677 [Myxococcota bacterium]|jgi:hypothetical protein